MGRISTVVFCENATIENPGTAKQRINCLGILSQNAVPAIPSLLSMSILVMAEIISGPISNLRLCIKSPEDNSVFDETIQINTDQLPQDNNTGVLTLALNLQNLVIKGLGKYKFEFYVNNQFDCDKHMDIIQKEF